MRVKKIIYVLIIILILSSIILYISIFFSRKENIKVSNLKNNYEATATVTANLLNYDETNTDIVWNNNPDKLTLKRNTSENVSIKVAYDENNVFFLIDDLKNTDKVELYVNINSENNKYHVFNINDIGTENDVQVMKKNGEEEEELSGWNVSKLVNIDENDNYKFFLSIPKNKLFEDEEQINQVYLNVVIKNDENQSIILDGSKIENISTWSTINFKKFANKTVKDIKNKVIGKDNSNLFMLVKDEDITNILENLNETHSGTENKIQEGYRKLKNKYDDICRGERTGAEFDAPIDGTERNDTEDSNNDYRSVLKKELPNVLLLYKINKEQYKNLHDFTYKTNATNYATWLKAQILKVCDCDDEEEGKFRNWEYGSFLNVGDITNAVAMTYNWLYDDLTDNEKELIEKALIENAIVIFNTPEYKDFFTPPSSNVNTNQDQVINSAMGMASLALLNKDYYLEKNDNNTYIIKDKSGIQMGNEFDLNDSLLSDMIEDIIAEENAKEKFNNLLCAIIAKSINLQTSFFEDRLEGGGYPEGMTYFRYGMGASIRFISSLYNLTGTDFDILDIEGLYDSLLYPVYIGGHSDKLFNYSDVSEATSAIGNVSNTGIIWLANAYIDKCKRDNPEENPIDIVPNSYYLYKIEQQYLSGMQNILWYNIDNAEKASEITNYAQNYLFKNIGIACINKNLDDISTEDMYIGIKTGKIQITHGDLDIGSFVLDALGERWIEDFGSENYNAKDMKKGELGRWNYYKKRAEGHSTIVINPREYPYYSLANRYYYLIPDQFIYSEMKNNIIEFNSNKDGNVLLWLDMTEAYNKPKNYSKASESNKDNGNTAKRKIEYNIEDKTAIIEDTVSINKRENELYSFLNISSDANIKISKNGKNVVLSKEDKDGNIKKVIVEISPNSITSAKFETMPKELLCEYLQNDDNDELEANTNVNEIEDIVNGEKVTLNINAVQARDNIMKYSENTDKKDNEKLMIHVSNLTKNKERTVGMKFIPIYTDKKNDYNYNVKFYNEDGTLLEEKSQIEYGENVIYTGTIPIKEANQEYTYTFKDWYIINNGNEEQADLDFITGDTDVYARYNKTKNKYTVTFYNEDGTETFGTSTVEYGDTAQVPDTVPEEYRNDFYVWYTDLTCTDEDDLTDVLTDREVYLGLKKYTINYILNEGTNNSENPETYTVEDTIILKEATREGYVFDGWYENENFTGEKVSQIGPEQTEDVILYAKWIRNEVIEITLNKTQITIEEDQTENLIATITPENATNKEVVWTSSDENVATVDGEGTVTAVGVGEATITAKTENGITATCRVTVTQKIINPTEITLNKTQITIEEEQTENLIATITPENATNKEVVWTSTNESVATVDEEGTVTAVGVGEAIITVTTENNMTATCSVTVTQKIINPTEITLNKTQITIEEEQTENLIATIAPENATNKEVIWTSSNESVATVEDGKVTAVGVGESTITAKTENGITATCSVRVVDSIPPEIQISKNITEITNNNVIVSLNSNKQLQELEGWDLSEDKKVLTKEYENNQDETITVKDLAGNEIIVNISVNNIDKKAPIASYKYGKTSYINNNITVEINFNEEVQELEGWKLSKDSQKLTKEYSVTTEEQIQVKDIAGNVCELNINVIVNENDNTNNIISNNRYIPRILTDTARRFIFF